MVDIAVVRPQQVNPVLTAQLCDARQEEPLTGFSRPAVETLPEVETDPALDGSANSRLRACLGGIANRSDFKVAAACHQF